jgi:hypothetical protein
MQSGFHDQAGGGLDDADLWMTGAELLFEPLAGGCFAVAEEDGFGGDAPGEIEEGVAVGVGRQIEILQFAAAGDFAGAGAEDKWFAWFGGFEAAAGGVGIGVADEEDGLARVAQHADGEVVGGGHFGQHASGQDEDSAGAEFNGVEFIFFQDDGLEFLGELEIGPMTVGKVGFLIVNFGEDAAEAADVDGLAGHVAGAHHQGEFCENFLGAAEGEGGNEDAAAAGEDFLDGGGEALDFLFAGEAWGRDAVAAGGFHDEDVGANVVKFGGFEEGLIVETDVAGEENGLGLAADEEAGGAEGVAGVEKFERGLETAGAGAAVGGPFNWAMVFPSLEEGFVFFDLVVREKGVFADAAGFALALHDVDGVVEDAAGKVGA